MGDYREAPSERRRRLLQAAADCVSYLLREGHQPADIINQLEMQHGAIYRAGDPHRLRCAGVTASCTWSRDKGLLDAWRKNATVKLSMLP